MSESNEQPSPAAAPLPPLSVGRRIGSVVAGFFIIFFLSFATDSLLRGIGVFPTEGTMSDGLFVLAAVHRAFAGAAGGWLTARIAPDHPLRHAFVLGLIGTMMNFAATLATWNRGPEFGPKWYPLALVALAIPTALAGAKIARPRA